MSTDFLLLFAVLIIIVLIVFSSTHQKQEGFLDTTMPTMTAEKNTISTVIYNTDFKTSTTISTRDENGISGFAVVKPNKTFSAGVPVWIIELRDIGKFTEACGSALKLWGDVINPNEVTNLEITFSKKEGFLDTRINTVRQNPKSMIISIRSPYGTYGPADTILVAYTLRKPKNSQESFTDATINNSVTYRNGTKFNSPLRGKLNTTYFDPSASWIMTDKAANGFVRFHAVLRPKLKTPLPANKAIQVFNNIRYGGRLIGPKRTLTQALMLNALGSDIYNVEILPTVFYKSPKTNMNIRITPKKTITRHSNAVVLIAGYYKF